MVTSPKRITPHSSTIIIIFVQVILSSCLIIVIYNVPVTGRSEHFAMCCTLSVKTVKPTLNIHFSIVYRCFKKFEENIFDGLACDTPPPPGNVYNFSDPDEALSHWTDLFLHVVNKHVPLRKKRVKQQKLPLWLNADIKQAMLFRENLRKQRKFVE